MKTIITNSKNLQSLKGSTEEMTMLLNLIESKGTYDPKRLVKFLDIIIEEIDNRKSTRSI